MVVNVGFSYNEEVGGEGASSLKLALKKRGHAPVALDYRAMMSAFSDEAFQALYTTPKGQETLFAHAKAQAEKLLKTVDCLVLTGNNAMLDPVLFGGKRVEGERYDFPRTIAEMALAHVAAQKGMPILGVCGGHQLLAVYRGGAIRDLGERELHIQPIINYQEVSILPNSMLASILKGINTLETFGAHSQVVETLGEKYIASARATGDSEHPQGGAIEAFESEHGAPLLTTQFHPEVALEGFPGFEALYSQPEGSDKEKNEAILQFIVKAGHAYATKKDVLAEIKQVNAPVRVIPIVPKKESPSFQIPWGRVLIIGGVTLISASLFAAFYPIGIMLGVGIIIGIVAGSLIAYGRELGLGVLNGIASLSSSFSYLLIQVVSSIIMLTAISVLREKLNKLEAPPENQNSFFQPEEALPPKPCDTLTDTPAKLFSAQTKLEESDEELPLSTDKHKPSKD